MVQSLKVILWGEEIGRLAWDVRRMLSYFMYNPAFLKKGLNISPLAAPVDGMSGFVWYIFILLHLVRQIRFIVLPGYRWPVMSQHPRQFLGFHAVPQR